MRVSQRAPAFVIPFLILGITVVAAGIASIHSLPLGSLVLLVTPAILIPLGHNSDRLGPKLREKNDLLMLESCESGMISRFRQLYRHLPANPRCRICLVPFGGIGRIFRIKPSRKNPNFCTSCLDRSPEGVHDMEVGVLFADIRGFTAWASGQPAAVAANRISRFYDLANRVLVKDDALIEFVGDQVMALYLPGFPSLRGDAADTMLAAAKRLVDAVELEAAPDSPRIGVGLNFGVASVGNVRKGQQKDFTAIGDVVNTASRFQSAAAAGEIVLADAVFERLTRKPERTEHRLLDVKGKSERIAVQVLAPKQGQRLPARQDTAAEEPQRA